MPSLGRSWLFKFLCILRRGIQPSFWFRPQRIVGYFPGYRNYAHAYHVGDIQADKLTHINYAFAKIADDNTVQKGNIDANTQVDYDAIHFDALALLKQQYPKVKTLISIGGWNGSARFSDVGRSAMSRESFATSAIAFMTQYGFDGIDLDWEYPVGGGLPTNGTNPLDRQNYVSLVQEIRRQLDNAAGPDCREYLLTIAAPASPGTAAHFDLPAMAASLDWISLMAYDIHGPWDGTTGFNAPLNAPAGDLSVTSALTNYLGSVPASKLVLGMPFHGHGFSGVPNGADGLGQPTSGAALGQDGESDAFPYDYVKNVVAATAGFSSHRDGLAEMPFLYQPPIANDLTRPGIWVNYDDPASIGRKADLVLAQRLAGAMFWELSNDRDGDLLGVLHDRLRPRGLLAWLGG